MNDPLLSALLSVNDAAAREREIERLIVDVTQPLAEKIIARYTLLPQDREDIVSTVNVRVVRKLRAVADGGGEHLARLDDYVATLTYNAVHDHLRRRYPERARLKNRLRYLLTHDERLALWTVGTDSVAGLAEWKGRAARTPHAIAAGSNTGTGLVEIFRTLGHPVAFDALVGSWNVDDAPPGEIELAERIDSARELEQRDFLRALWREIRLLPPPQRKALLLNLRDSEVANPIALLALTGTASIDEIAATMEMSSEELAALWNELPLEDRRIAEMLGLTRQQVINLRKSARQRLARRITRGFQRS